MENNKRHVAVGIALIIGLIAGYYFGVNRPAKTAMNVHVMEQMSSALAGKTGDDFDKAFLGEMIIHHEGAVDMAEAALGSARHNEIKAMANEIISAQTSEISQMRSWLKSWYGIE